MRDVPEYAMNDNPPSEMGENADNSRALDAYDEQRRALLYGSTAADYTELFNRLQSLIDSATDTIRELRRENSDLTNKVGMLEGRMRQIIEGAGDDSSVRIAMERLERMLHPHGTQPPPPPPHATPYRPTTMYSAPTNGATPIHAPVPPPTPVQPWQAAPRPTPMYDAPPPAPPAYEPPADEPMPVYEDTSTYRQPPQMARPPEPPPAPVHAMPAYEPPPTTAPVPVQERVYRAGELPMAPSEPAPEPPPVQQTAPIPIERPVETPPPPMPIAPPVQAVQSGGSAEKSTGMYALVAYPFTRFSDLGQFQSSLQELVGIHDVQVRRFAQGTLEMRLAYDGVSPLTNALQSLSSVQNVEEEEPYRLRVRLDLSHAP